MAGGISVLVSLSIVFLLVTFSSANQCYSCAGICHNDHCNCQMGSCSAAHCFIERKPTDEPDVYRITKGCLRRPSRTLLGCDFDRFSDHTMCICAGKFCNDHIFMRNAIRRNVTCRKCTERNPECSDTCHGQWCHEDTTTGASGCGFGPPALPYFYKGPELLYYKNKLCVTISRGVGPPRKHCICNTNHCNQYYRYRSSNDGTMRSRSLITHSSLEVTQPLYECVSCEVTAVQDAAVTPSCKTHRCVGHFCTLAAQRLWPAAPALLGAERGAAGGSGRAVQPFPVISEKQGCINVSDSTQIQLGCTHKWMSGDFEELMCACRGNLCNRDLSTAFASLRLPSLLTLSTLSLLRLFIA